MGNITIVSIKVHMQLPISRKWVHPNIFYCYAFYQSFIKNRQILLNHACVHIRMLYNTSVINEQCALGVK